MGVVEFCLYFCNGLFHQCLLLSLIMGAICCFNLWMKFVVSCSFFLTPKTLLKGSARQSSSDCPIQQLHSHKGSHPALAYVRFKLHNPKRWLSSVGDATLSAKSVEPLVESLVIMHLLLWYLQSIQ